MLRAVVWRNRELDSTVMKSVWATLEEGQREERRGSERRGAQRVERESQRRMRELWQVQRRHEQWKASREKYTRLC